MRLKLKQVYPKPATDARQYEGFAEERTEAPKVLGVDAEGKVVVVPSGQSESAVRTVVQQIVATAMQSAMPDLTSINNRLTALEGFVVSSYAVTDVIGPTVDLAIVTVTGITLLLPAAAERKKPLLVRCDADYFTLGSGELIEGETTQIVYNKETFMCANDGATWRVV